MAISRDSYSSRMVHDGLLTDRSRRESNANPRLQRFHTNEDNNLTYRAEHAQSMMIQEENPGFEHSSSSSQGLGETGNIVDTE